MQTSQKVHSLCSDPMCAQVRLPVSPLPDMREYNKEDEPIHILAETYYGKTYYYLRGFSKSLSKRFESVESATRLRSYMYEKFPDAGLLSSLIFNKSYRDIYDKWMSDNDYPI